MKDKLIPALAGFLALALVAAIYFGVNHLMTRPSDFENLKTQVATENGNVVKLIEQLHNTVEKLPDGDNKFRLRASVMEFRGGSKSIAELIKKYDEELTSEGSLEAQIQLEYALDCLEVNKSTLDLNQKIVEVQLTFVSL